MAQLIKPKEVKVITQDGEVQVSISLELTINLNTNALEVSALTNSNKTEIKNNKKDEQLLPEGGDWLIPDFDATPKLDFGKRD